MDGVVSGAARLPSPPCGHPRKFGYDTDRQVRRGAARVSVTVSRLDGVAQGIDQRLDATVLHLHRGLVDHQARADRGDQFLGLQAVGAQGVAGIHDVDDLVGETDQRRQLPSSRTA